MTKENRLCQLLRARFPLGCFTASTVHPSENLGDRGGTGYREWRPALPARGRAGADGGCEGRRQMWGMRGGRPRWLSRPRGVWPSSRVKGPGHVGRAGGRALAGARAGAGWRGAVHFTVYPAGVAPHTEAVFPSSSLSCKVIMNISFMFSHIYYSYAQTPDEMPRLSSSVQPPGRGCVSSPGSVCASVGGPGRPARTRTKRGLAPRMRSSPSCGPRLGGEKLTLTHRLPRPVLPGKCVLALSWRWVLLAAGSSLSRENDAEPGRPRPVKDRLLQPRGRVKAPSCWSC